MFQNLRSEFESNPAQATASLLGIIVTVGGAGWGALSFFGVTSWTASSWTWVTCSLAAMVAGALLGTLALKACARSPYWGFTVAPVMLLMTAMVVGQVGRAAALAPVELFFVGIVGLVAYGCAFAEGYWRFLDERGWIASRQYEDPSVYWSMFSIIAHIGLYCAMYNAVLIS